MTAIPVAKASSKKKRGKSARKSGEKSPSKAGAPNQSGFNSSQKILISKKTIQNQTSPIANDQNGNIPVQRGSVFKSLGTDPGIYPTMTNSEEIDENDKFFEDQRICICMHAC